MEQLIEIYVSDDPTDPALMKAKRRADELTAEGWLVHDTCVVNEAADFSSKYQDYGLQMVMITYRREGYVS